MTFLSSTNSFPTELPRLVSKLSRRCSAHWPLAVAAIVFGWLAFPTGPFAAVVRQAIAQPLEGDSLTLNSAMPYVALKDITGSPLEYYFLSSEPSEFGIHTPDTFFSSEAAPLRMYKSASSNQLTLDNGITWVQDSLLIVRSFDGGMYGPAKIEVRDDSENDPPRMMLELNKYQGGSQFGFTNSTTGRTWTFQNNRSDNFLINLLGTGGNEFSIRNNGMVTMGPGGVLNFVLDPSGNLTVLGTISSSSDHDLKEAFDGIDHDDVLARLRTVPVTTWQYRRDTDGARHMGPTSQDFHNAFQLGSNDKSISVTDAAGVSFACIQALADRCDVLQQECRERDERIDALEGQLAAVLDRISELESAFPR